MVTSYANDDLVPVMLPRKFLADIIARSFSVETDFDADDTFTIGKGFETVMTETVFSYDTTRLIGSAIWNAHNTPPPTAEKLKFNAEGFDPKPAPMGYTSPLISVNLPLQLVAESINGSPFGSMYTFGAKMVELLSAHGLANDYLPTVSRSLEEAWVLHNFGDDANITQKVSPATEFGNRIDRIRKVMEFDGRHMPMTQELLERAIAKVDGKGGNEAEVTRRIALEVLSTLTGNSFGPIANFPLGELIVSFYSEAILSLVDIEVVTRVTLK